MLCYFLTGTFALPSLSPNQRLLSLSHSLFLFNFKPLHCLFVSFFIILLFFTLGSLCWFLQNNLLRADTPYQSFYLFNLFPEQRMRAFYPSLCLRSVECGYEWEEQVWIGLVLNAWTPLLMSSLQMTCSSLSCDIITYRFHYIAQQIFTVEVKPELWAE